MRYLLSLLLALVLCTCVRAQVGVRVDGEYVEWCMVDVLGPDQIVSFTRVISMTTKEVVDIGVDGSIYLVVGNPKTCEAYQLEQVTTDPVTDLYSDCQCVYTISQEDHRVTEIRGGNVQEWDVEFQEVVRRRCGSQVSATVVHRDTLTRTSAISPTVSLQYGWNFTAPGQYVDQVNLRYYTATTSTTTISLDLNPNTVTTTYPGLGLDPADFEFDGSNLSDMAAAYQTVLNDQVTGTTNSVTAQAIGSTLSIFTQFLHEPNFPYVTQPRSGDSDYLVTATTPGGLVVIGNPGLGTTTSTTNYTEECEAIFTTEYGSYLTYSQATPLEWEPRLNVQTTLQAQSSNESAFCDVDPAICAAVDPGEIALDGCVSICDTVEVAIVQADTLPVIVTALPADTCGASKQAHQQFTGNSGSLAADTYASVAITVTSGTVAVTIDGTTLDYPTGFTAHWTVTNLCDRLTESFTIDAANGSTIITTLQ